MQLSETHDRSRWAIFAGIFALCGMFVLHLCELAFVDPDMFHEMALFREALALGRLPLEDRFAYTPTVYPSVHHEWGAGAVMYAVATTLGPSGIMLLKYVLTLGVMAACFSCARRRGASLAMVVTLVPVTILAGCIGFTTIRAQMFTMLFLALLLNWLEIDRQGGRRWLWAFVPVYVLWLNLHAGFVVGAVVIAVHAVEQRLRGERVGHLLALLAGLAALVIVNPYGWRYYPYLVHALTMARPMIIEWRPLWEADPTMFRVYVVSLLLAVYAASTLGWRRLSGVLVLGFTAYAAARHMRHLSLYLVAWLCTVPGWLEQTRLGERIATLWRTRWRWVLGFATAIGAVCLARAVPREPWKLQVPTSPVDETFGRPMYPAGVVAYLRDVDFHGNLMVPFVPGGYVIWQLYPRVKVSIDGRYEVAYQHGILEENEDLYQTKNAWRETLAKYPTDAVLVPRSCPLARSLPAQGAWQRVYRDDAYDLYARAPATLPTVDRSGEALPASFP